VIQAAARGGTTALTSATGTTSTAASTRAGPVPAGTSTSATQGRPAGAVPALAASAGSTSIGRTAGVVHALSLSLDDSPAVQGSDNLSSSNDRPSPGFPAPPSPIPTVSPKPPAAPRTGSMGRSTAAMSSSTAVAPAVQGSTSGHTGSTGAGLSASVSGPMQRSDQEGGDGHSNMRGSAASRTLQQAAPLSISAPLQLPATGPAPQRSAAQGKQGVQQASLILCHFSPPDTLCVMQDHSSIFEGSSGFLLSSHAAK
jgi:hypothetical protein